MTAPGAIQVEDLWLDAPGGRPLFRDLALHLDAGDRVALVGRNGGGKSSLLAVLAGATAPDRGRVLCAGRRLLVPQELPPDSGPSAVLESPGERRRRHLERARTARPDLLLLDEPTQDLDAQGRAWLLDWLARWPGSLVVASHDRQLLRTFHEFFVVAESGCRHRSGSFDAVREMLTSEEHDHERRYVRNLHRLLEREEHNASVRRRRAHKRNLGRLHEMGRCPSRARLNTNRSYAQESQGKRAVQQRARIDAARDWARATRRALAVELPLELTLPRLPADPGPPIVMLDDVTARAGGRVLFEDLSLCIGRDRIAVTGPNGAGKSTLLEILTGRRRPDLGSVRCDAGRIGFVAQEPGLDAARESLVDLLAECVPSIDVARILRAHGFPLALAERPLASLSPGERLRAVLMRMCRREPAPELLVLDEPTADLDLLGAHALERVLSAWAGGLVVASHDPDFLEAIGASRRLELGNGPAVSSEGFPRPGLPGGPGGMKTAL